MSSPTLAAEPERSRPVPVAPRGGSIIALVGGDGAGKSTCVRALADWLASRRPTMTAHLGRPPRSWLTLAVGAALKAFGGDYLQLLRQVCLARDRYRLYLRARRFARRGGVALCERYPIEENSLLAGPVIPRMLAGDRRRPLAERLGALEARYYRRIPRPDALLVLLVEPEVAVRRKTDEPEDYVRARARVVWETDWSGTGARTIDASRPLDCVLADLRRAIRDALGDAAPVVLELVGPAGAGKSTVARALAQHDPRVRTGLRLWGLPRARLALEALRQLPALVRLCVRARAPLFEEVAFLVRLETLRREIARARRLLGRLVVLDEGPVFALAWLALFGHPIFRNGRLGGWRARTLRRWADALDALVLLDAPDAVLAHRVRARAKPHRVKHASDRDVYEFVAAYRGAFAEITQELLALDGAAPRLIALTSGEESGEQLAERVRVALDPVP